MGLTALVIDDERPSLDEISFLLRADERIGEVLTCNSATDALRLLQDVDEQPDVVFLDVEMPGLTGLELAQVLTRFRSAPPIVFVTAHEAHAVEAFDLQAVDYVLKPVRAERLAEAVRRVVDRVDGSERAPATTDLQVPVELGGVTRFVSRAAITHVEAQGDYVRLHTADASHLVRTPLTQLEAEWEPAGFVRIHRSLLVSIAHVGEVRMDGGRCSVVVRPSGVELVVARRHTRELRDLLGGRSRS